MKNLAKVRDENEGAFTLIELLVVILIIGILAAIAIPMFLNQRKAAVDSSVESDVKNAATQVETWAVSNPSKDVAGITVTNVNGTIDVANDEALELGETLKGIKIGEGTTLTIQAIDGGNTGDYRIQGVNKDGNRAKADAATYDELGNSATTTFEGIFFDSAQGGLK